MKYIKLGNTDIDVSIMALGCWPFAGGKAWGYQDDAVSVQTVHAALDAGINFFDTAEGYENGHSERVLGQGLLGRRDEAVIATKVSASHLKKEDVIVACEQSLANLQTDYIDLYQIHWPNHNVPLSETVEALLRLQEQGKIRAIGVSNFDMGDMTEMLSHCDCQTNQMPYSLLWRGIEARLKPLCQQNGVGIICYSPLAQGLLTGRYAHADEVPDYLARTRLYQGDRPNAQHKEPGCEAEVFTALAEIRRIAEECGHSMAEVSLAWVKQQPGVNSFLVGARSPEELSWNLPVAEITLADDVISALSAATEPIRAYLGTNLDPWMAPSRMR